MGIEYNILTMNTLAERTQGLYNAIAVPYNEAFPIHNHPEHRQFFIDRLRQGARILDAGCAGGRDTNFFSEKSFNATGIDFSAGEIAYAKTKYPNVDFREADLLRLPEIFPRAEFDGVYTYATLDHLRKRDIPRVVGNFNLILKMNGVLLLCTRKGKGVLWTDDNYSLHKKRRFTLMESDELQQMLRRKGFDIDQFETFPSLTRKNMEFNLALCRKIKDI